MPDYLGDLQQLVTGYVEGGGLRVSVKTSYGPEIPIYTGKGKDAPPGPDYGIGDAIGRLIGFRAQVIIRDARGKVLTKYGPDSPTDWVRVSILLALLAGAGYLVVRRWL